MSGRGALLFAVSWALSGVLPGLAAASPSWGDYRHEYLLPEQRDSLFRLYGFAGVSFAAEEAFPGDGGSGWSSGVPDRSASGLWVAGSAGERIGYFAEGAYYYEANRLEAGPARIDIRLHGEGLHLRGGRFHFPFGLEPRSAPPRINHFIERPRIRSAPKAGVGAYGEIFEGVLNWYGGVTEGFPAEWADSVTGRRPGARDGEAWGGRLGLSPGPGLELGFSYAEEEGGGFGTILRGADFSVRNGPLLLQAEWARLRRWDGGAGEKADVAYGRLGHRIVEYSERFEAIEVLLGVDYLDPDREVSGDRIVEYLGGISVAPRSSVIFKGIYRVRYVEGARSNRALVEFLIFW
ncbi:MAG: hypothetical protein ABIK65_14905 [Candidatus Eisenbacteria bacterium]